MYPSVLLTDTTRRTLSPDDELGVSEIYPHRHEVCPPPASGGCSVALAHIRGHDRGRTTVAFCLPGAARRPGRSGGGGGARAEARRKRPMPELRPRWRSGSSVSRWRAAIWGARTWSRGPRTWDRWSARSRLRMPPMSAGDDATTGNQADADARVVPEDGSADRVGQRGRRPDARRPGRARADPSRCAGRPIRHCLPRRGRRRMWRIRAGDDRRLRGWSRGVDVDRSHLGR